MTEFNTLSAFTLYQMQTTRQGTRLMEDKAKGCSLYTSSCLCIFTYALKNMHILILTSLI